MKYAAGTVVRLTSTLDVTIGAVYDLRLHPSGTRYDGPAVLVSAWYSGNPDLDGPRGSEVGPLGRFVSLSDPSRREVVRRIRADGTIG